MVSRCEDRKHPQNFYLRKNSIKDWSPSKEISDFLRRAESRSSSHYTALFPVKELLLVRGRTVISSKESRKVQEIVEKGLVTEKYLRGPLETW